MPAKGLLHVTQFRIAWQGTDQPKQKYEDGREAVNNYRLFVVVFVYYLL